MATANSKICSQSILFTAKNIVHNMAVHMMDTEKIFMRKGMAFSFRKSRIYSPKTGWLSNRLYNCSELRANSVADSNKKGVVGKTGKKIPAIPKLKLIIPKNTSKYFINNPLFFHARVLKRAKVVIVL